MDNTSHKMQELFAQLGLDNEPEAISEFIRRHRPIQAGVRIFEAPFWSASQSSLLKEKLQEDGDWAILIDTLNAELRDPPTPAG